jgi:hypothetical protein
MIMLGSPVRSPSPKTDSLFNRSGHLRAHIQLLLPEQGIGAEIRDLFS